MKNDEVIGKTKKSGSLCATRYLTGLYCIHSQKMSTKKLQLAICSEFPPLPPLIQMSVLV